MPSFTRLALVGLLLVMVVCSGCSSTLPLGEPQEYANYSVGVLVGGITRDPVTGKYAVLADGAPLPIANFNDEHEPLADTIDEDDLAQLIGAQAHQIAASEEQNEQTRKSVFESRPPLVQFSGYRSQRLYIGPRLGQP
jgi:hypothetical protein